MPTVFPLANWNDFLHFGTLFVTYDSHWNLTVPRLISERLAQEKACPLEGELCWCFLPYSTFPLNITEQSQEKLVKKSERRRRNIMRNYFQMQGLVHQWAQNCPLHEWIVCNLLYISESKKALNSSCLPLRIAATQWNTTLWHSKCFPGA